MREVDVDAKVLSHVDRFEPASDAFEASQPRADGIERYAKRQADARRAQGVVDVEAGGHMQRYLRFAERSLHAKSRTRTSDAEVERMQVGRSRQTVGPAARDRAAGEALEACVVTVQHRCFFGSLVRRVRSQIDQARLGLEVVVPGGVVVEVVMADVGECRDVEVAGPYALL